MPYIKLEARAYFNELLDKLGRSGIADAGELNFLFTEIIKQYYVTHQKNYATANDVVGALESCKQEFYRRIVGPYEDHKVIENGDVYVS